MELYKELDQMLYSRACYTIIEYYYSPCTEGMLVLILFLLLFWFVKGPLSQHLQGGFTAVLQILWELLSGK